VERSHYEQTKSNGTKKVSPSQPVKISSPTRIDLAGGTLDLWPLYLFLGQAKTVNMAIDIETEAQIIPRQDRSILIHSKDLNQRTEFTSLKHFLSDTDPKFSLFRAVVQFWNPIMGFELHCHSMSPLGGGLGGSSSLTVSLMKAFRKYLGEGDLNDIHQFVRVCANIEAQVLNTPTGTQDYYPAYSGGLNVLTYTTRGVQQEIITTNQTQFLLNHFMLVYTGKSHHSGLNNFEVMKKAVAGDPHTMNCLRELADIAARTAEVCRQRSWKDLPELFRKEYAARVKLEPSFSGPEIQQLHSLSMDNGADAVKICGAGGGGCVLVWVQPEKQKNLSSILVKNNFRVLPMKLVDSLPA
jgi:D-glycero-alpha-D-manno-heptose-7-phosphate kinase